MEPTKQTKYVLMSAGKFVGVNSEGQVYLVENVNLALAWTCFREAKLFLENTKLKAIVVQPADYQWETGLI